MMQLSGLRPIAGSRRDAAEQATLALGLRRPQFSKIGIILWILWRQRRQSRLGDLIIAHTLRGRLPSPPVARSEMHRAMRPRLHIHRVALSDTPARTRRDRREVVGGYGYGACWRLEGARTRRAA
jgi:hypothetical protein